jgi:hypothetical protein
MAFGDHVLVKLGLDTKTFNKGLTSAQERAKAFGANFKSAFVGALGTAVISNASKRIIEFGASIGDMSDRLGVSSEFLQALQYGAEQSGVSAKGATIALQRFARRSAEAGAVGGSLKKTLDDLGISLNKNNGSAKNSEELFTEFGEALREMQDPAEKLRVAFKFLDTEGVALVQMFAKGKPSLKEFGEEAKALGLIISNEKVKALQDASGELEKMGRQFKVFGANILPPLFEKFKQFVNILQEAYKKVIPLTDVIIQAGKALATYWIAGKVIAGVTAVIGGFSMLTKVIRGTAGAVTLLNTTTKANPIGLLASAVVLALPLLDKFINKADNSRKELEKLSKVKIDNFNKEIERLGDLMAENAKEAQDFNKELTELMQKDIKLSSKEELDNLRKKEKLLQDSLQAEQKLAEAQQAEAKAQKKLIEDLKKQAIYVEDNLSLKEAIAQAEEKLAQIREEQTFTGREIAKNQLEAYKNSKLLTEAEKEANDLVFARAKGIERLLNEEEKELINLERANAKSKALREGNLEQVAILEKQFAIEDKILSLYKGKKISLEEAFNLANKLVNATDEEKRLLGEVNKLEADKARLAEGQKKEVEARLEALKKEQALQKQAREEVNQNLAVLRLRARGQGELADLLQARIDNEKALLDIQNNQGLALGKAVAQRREELALLAKIKAGKIAEAKADIQKNAVEEQANRRLGDARDKEDRKRIRAGKQVARLEDQIARLEKRGNPNDKALLDKLKARRQDQLQLVLDDNAKKQIAELDKQKIQLKKDFDAQQRAIGLAEKKLKAEEAKQKAEIAQAKQGVIQEGNKQEQRLKAILDGRNKALEAMQKAMIAEFKKIQAPAIKINNQQAPAVLKGNASGDTQKVFVVNQLEQGTQNEILRTLQGYFVNQ